MRTRKFKQYLICTALPKVGDTMICVQKKNVNYGLTTKVNTQFNADYSDTKNWRVVVDVAKQYYPNYGDKRHCKCGHTYERHFNIDGTKYAVGHNFHRCSGFQEKTECLD